MSKAIIWDLDGTLLDSYEVIVQGLFLALKDFGITMELEYIHRFAIEQSSNALVDKVAAEHNLSAQEILERYRQISSKMYRDIVLMPNSMETLRQLSDKGVRHFVYTHRGKTTLPVLENLKMEAYFSEILTSQSGFPRKPAPDAITYLVEKYKLDPADTYYVGDRSLDMECAHNAGIRSILYLPKGSKASPTGTETYVAEDLLDILNVI